jgi:hypothetical protein
VIFGAFTAASFLALFATQEPAVYRDNPERVAVIAVASERAQADLMPHWTRHPRLLGASLAVVALGESHLAESVHDGSRRGAVGEACLAQVHPINGHWRPYAASFEGLVGVGIDETTDCLSTGLATLVAADQQCTRQGYRTHWLSAMMTAYQFGGRCRPSKTGRERAEKANRWAWQEWTPTAEMTELVEKVKGQP